MKNRCECDKALARSLYVLSGFAPDKIGTPEFPNRSPTLGQYKTKPDGTGFQYDQQCRKRV